MSHNLILRCWSKARVFCKLAKESIIYHSISDGIIRFRLVCFNVFHIVFGLLRTPKRIQSTLLCLMAKFELF